MMRKWCLTCLTKRLSPLSSSVRMVPTTNVRYTTLVKSARFRGLRFHRAEMRVSGNTAIVQHQRSLAETAMFRFKTVFGDHLQSRALPQQATEAAIKCAALNRMTQLGMPDSYRV